MPVKKSGDKWTMGNKEYDTEDAANEAYKAYLAKAMGVEDTDDKPKKKKKGAKKQTAVEESED